MFLQATFFTTAGKRSEAFLPLAIICTQKQTNTQSASWRLKGSHFDFCFDTRYQWFTQRWIWQNLKVKSSRSNVLLHPVLTATMRFMASSFRESLLLSSISFKSSCLQKRDRERVKKKPHTEKWSLSFQTRSPHWAEPDYPKFEQERQTCYLFFSSKCWKFIKVCERDPEMIPFEVRNSPGKIWKALKVRLVKKKKQDNWNVT